MSDQDAREAATQADTDQAVEMIMDLLARLDILCGNLPEGIQPEHRRVAEQMGVRLPERST